MEQIAQLKTMRDDALERLQINPDFKLVNSLDALISDLESVLAPVEVSLSQESEVAEDDLTTDETAIDISEDDGAPADPSLQSDDEVEIEISEISAEVAASEPEEISSAIEALEAELSQANNSTDDTSAPITPSLN